MRRGGGISLLGLVYVGVGLADGAVAAGAEHAHASVMTKMSEARSIAAAYAEGRAR